jgi:hypothetical protein
MGAPALTVNLPPATTIGDRVGVRFDPSSVFWSLVVMPDGTYTINKGYGFGFTIYTKGSCYTFVVGEIGDWWIESAYVEPPL